MAVDYTSTELLSEVKRKFAIPDSQDLYSDSDLCKAMTDVQRIEIVPYMISAVEGYFETEYQFTTDGSTTEYLLPARAVGMKVASIAVVQDTTRYPLMTVTLPQLDEMFWIQRRAVAIRGNYIKFAPGFNDVITVAVRYYRAPSEIVPVAQAGKILSILGNVLTLDNAPSGFATGTVVDIHRGSAPFQPISDDITLSAVSGFDVTVPDGTLYSVGDWVCFKGQCVIPQIPLELFPVLTSYAGLQFLESQSSPEEVQIARGKYDLLKENLFQLITPRNVAAPKGVGVGAHYRYRR